MKVIAEVTQAAISLFPARPWRHASTPTGRADAPEIRVRSRSKKAADLVILIA
jgi:hypothetical protein